MGRTIDHYRDYSLPEVIFRRSYNEDMEFCKLYLDTPEGVFYGFSKIGNLESGIHDLLCKWNLELRKKNKPLIILDDIATNCTEYDVWSILSENGYYFYCELVEDAHKWL